MKTVLGCARARVCVRTKKNTRNKRKNKVSPRRKVKEREKKSGWNVEMCARKRSERKKMTGRWLKRRDEIWKGRRRRRREEKEEGEKSLEGMGEKKKRDSFSGGRAAYAVLYRARRVMEERNSFAPFSLLRPACAMRVYLFPPPSLLSFSLSLYLLFFSLASEFLLECTFFFFFYIKKEKKVHNRVNPGTFLFAWKEKYEWKVKEIRSISCGFKNKTESNQGAYIRSESARNLYVPKIARRKENFSATPRRAHSLPPLPLGAPCVASGARSLWRKWEKKNLSARTGAGRKTRRRRRRRRNRRARIESVGQWHVAAGFETATTLEMESSAAPRASEDYPGWDLLSWKTVVFVLQASALIAPEERGRGEIDMSNVLFFLLMLRSFLLCTLPITQLPLRQKRKRTMMMLLLHLIIYLVSFNRIFLFPNFFTTPSVYNLSVIFTISM